MKAKFSSYSMKDFPSSYTISCSYYSFCVIDIGVYSFHILRSNIEWIFSSIYFILCIL